MLELRKDDFDSFFDAPYHAYRGDTQFVQPMRAELRRMLDPKANPLFRGGAPHELWTAVRDRVPVGRLVCHVHPASNAKFGWRRAYYGFFECTDDLAVARALMERAQDFARAQGCDTLIGDFSLTAMQQIGVVTGGFERRAYVDQRWNPAHLPGLLTALDFTMTFPMRTFEVDLARVPLDALEREFVAPARADASLRWTTVDRKRLPEHLEEIRQVLNDSFAENPMFVPLTADEMRFQSDGLSLVIDPAITQLVHDAEGPAAVMVCIPDLNPFLRATRSRYSLRTLGALWRLRTRRDRAVVIFGGVARRHQGRRIAGAVIAIVARALLDRGYRTLGVTWISDENQASLAQMRRLGAREMHRCALFTRAVAP